MVIVSDSGEPQAGQSLGPADVTAWLRLLGWSRTAALGTSAEQWRHDSDGVVVPMRAEAPDFPLRWEEMFRVLARALKNDADGIRLSIAEAGSDIAEFRAIGEGRIDDSIPLGDAATLIDSVRRTMQASANAALQPRSYYGHSLPDSVRDHASGVRMGQTRRGSYIIPVISRVPILEADDDEDAVLFDDVAYQPFARKAMLCLADGLSALRDLTHGEQVPSRSKITEAVGRGVSYDLCEAVANTLDTRSITDLDVTFSWAARLPSSSAPASVRLEGASAQLVHLVSSVLKGEPIVGPQTFVGYVKRLDRGEEDAIGRITLRALHDDHARNISIDLNDDDYHVAGVANTDRLMVSATGVLQRESGKTLRFTEVTDFHLVAGVPSLMDNLDNED